MLLTSKHELKENSDLSKNGETCALPQNHKYKNIEYCFIMVMHVPRLDNEDEAFITKFSDYELPKSNIQ